MGARARGELLCLGWWHSLTKWTIFSQLNHGKLLVGNYCNGLVAACCGIATVELWAIAPILLLLWSTQLTPKWGIDHAVLGRSTARTTNASGSRHHLFPLLLINLATTFIILS
jgi:hypothetical protein